MPSGSSMKPSVSKTAPPRTDERSSGFLALLLVLLGFHVLKPAPSPPSSSVLVCPAPCYVQVEGEVRNPGVHAFCGARPRVEDVIRRAGCLCVNCSSGTPSGSATVISGQKLLVFQNGPECRIYVDEMSAHYKVSLSIPLSVNRESREGLTAIPGIGFTLAEAIVKTRDNRGGFKTLDEIAEVPGIGKALVDKIKPYLVL